MRPDRVRRELIDIRPAGVTDFAGDLPPYIGGRIAQWHLTQSLPGERAETVKYLHLGFNVALDRDGA
jgi:hypothetical protein